MKKKGESALFVRFLSSMLLLAVLFCGAIEKASARPEVDRKYALESVGCLQAWDNVDQLFAEYVTAAYQDYFSRQSRFRFQDLSRGNQILTQGKISYSQVIEDSEVLSRLARAMRIDSLIRTRILKEGPVYRVSLEWLHAPKMHLLASENFTLEELQVGETGFSREKLAEAFQKGLDRLIEKVPFFGHVTGRDHQFVTINLGTKANLRPGDSLLIASLDEVKKHPLLNSIVDWKLSSVGKLEVEEVDGEMAFCKVIEEELGKKISRYQKVTQIIRKPELQIETSKTTPLEVETAPFLPSLGFANGGLWLGTFSRQFSTLNGTVGKTGGGFFTGAKVDGQLWLTRDWFSELSLGYGFSGVSQSDIATGTASTATGASNSTLHWRFNGGYTYYFTKRFQDSPKAWIKLGYRSTSYSLPSLPAESLSPISFKGFFLGVGGDLPLRDEYGIKMNFDWGLMSSATETGSSAVAIRGAQDVGFFIGGYYQFQPRMTVHLGLDVIAHGADYTNESTLSQKIVSFGPSLVYFF